MRGCFTRTRPRQVSKTTVPGVEMLRIAANHV